MTRVWLLMRAAPCALARGVAHSRHCRPLVYWLMFRGIRTMMRWFLPTAARWLPPPVRRTLVAALYVAGEPWLWQSTSYQQWRRRRFAKPATLSGITPIGPTELELALARLAFPRVAAPVLIILITTFGNLRLTTGCLLSIADNPPSVDFEIIVLDDASGRLEMAALAGIPGIHFVAGPENLGYLRTVNGGSQLAKGQFLWLLNDDTVVTRGAADALLATLRDVDTCAMAGSRLLNLDGTVQEAGGIVWSDGTATLIGSGTDLGDVTTRYRHEVDYCSGASLMLRTADFLALGGYDERFVPAYYEDTDLAFALRDKGGRVLIAPGSVVFHIGGGSYGPSSRQLLAVNRSRFVEKWRSVLEAKHFQPGHRTFLAHDHAAHRHAVLLVAQPTGASDLGGSVEALLVELSSSEVAVKLWLDGTFNGDLVEHLGERGVELVSANRDRRLDRWLWQHGRALSRILVVGEVSRSTAKALQRHAAGKVLRLPPTQSQLPALGLTPIGALAKRLTGGGLPPA